MATKLFIVGCGMSFIGNSYKCQSDVRINAYYACWNDKGMGYTIKGVLTWAWSICPILTIHNLR